MSRIKWNQVGQKFYETGVEQAVLYPALKGAYPKGCAWDGMISVTQSSTGAEPTPLYAGDVKYVTLLSNEDFKGSIEAYYSPKEFDACDGTAELVPGVTVSQQVRNPFGLCTKTLIGNDVDGTNAGYKLHLFYGCLASPSEKQYQTINESPEAMTLSWEFTTTPVNIPGMKPSAKLTIDSRDIDAEKLKLLEDILYGTDGEGEDDAGTEARLPLPEEVIKIITA